MAVFKPKVKKMVTVTRNGTTFQREQEVNADQPSAASQQRLAAAPRPYVSNLRRVENVENVESEEERRIEREAYYDHRLKYDEAVSAPAQVQTLRPRSGGGVQTDYIPKSGKRIEIPRDDSLNPGDRVQVDGEWYTIDNRLTEEYVETGERPKSVTVPLEFKVDQDSYDRLLSKATQ